jgi:hypothetical protein
MTTRNASAPKPATTGGRKRTAQISGRTKTRDPILAELWQIKAQLNQAADYDVATLIKQTRQAAKAGWLPQKKRGAVH